MQYQVLAQNLPDGQFSAFVIGVPDIVAEGATEEEALDKATTLLKNDSQPANYLPSKSRGGDT